MKKIPQCIEKLFIDATNLVSSIFKAVVYLIIAGLLLWGGWKVLVKVADLIVPDKWTLMVCDEKFNNVECYSNSYTIPGFKSEKECMLEGATRFSREGFECGSNCKDDGLLKICKKICNKGGCS